MSLTTTTATLPRPVRAGATITLALSAGFSLALVGSLGFAKIGEYDDPEDGIEHVYGLREPGPASR